MRRDLTTHPGALAEHTLELIPALAAFVDAGQRVRCCNKTVEAWFGLDRDRVLGRTVREVVGAQAFERFRGRIDQALAGRRAEFELPLGEGSQRPRHLLIALTPDFGVDGMPTGFAVCAVDLTYSSEAEAALRERVAKLEGALANAQAELRTAHAVSAAKTRFLAGISHEIRTPMTAILGFSDMLLDNGMTRADQLIAIQTVRRNGEHLVRLIDDVLDLAGIEAGRLEVVPAPCSVGSVLTDVMATLRPRATAKRLALESEVVGPMPLSIQTDATRLRQILMNLVANAIRFTENGGVKVGVRLLIDNGEPQVEFAVSDTGIGLTASQIDRVFQPFTQAERTTYQRFGGTGLGLSISQRLTELLGGRIQVESTPGAGSTFRVSIPTGPLDERRRLVGSAPAAGSSIDRRATPTPTSDAVVELPYRIMLVEDGADNRKLLALLLKSAGAEVTIAEDGYAAVEQALGAYEPHPDAPRPHPFDIILMDMQMPRMDGYDATRWLRRHGYNGPILALTAHAMVGDEPKCLAAGCDGYASKPITRQRLIDDIRRLVGAHRRAPV